MTLPAGIRAATTHARPQGVRIPAMLPASVRASVPATEIHALQPVNPPVLVLHAILPAGGHANSPVLRHGGTRAIRAWRR